MPKSQAHTVIEVAPDGSIKLRDLALLMGLTYRSVYQWTRDETGPLRVVPSENPGAKGEAARVLMQDVLAYKTRKAVDAAIGGAGDDDVDDEDDDAGKPGRRGYSYERAKAKRMHHQAGIAEVLELREKREVVPRMIVARVVEEEIVTPFRAAALDLPAKLAGKVAVAGDERETYVILRDYVHGMLDEIADGPRVETLALERMDEEEGVRPPEDEAAT